MAVMNSNEEQFTEVVSILTNEFGKLILKSKPYDFNFTDYYEREFGKNLRKVILIFEKTVEKHDLILIRIKTGEIENQLVEKNKRTVNIDPGYISETELVLATKKAKPWKEFLGNEVYVHKILEFKQDQLITFNHTFKDYKQDKNQAFLKEARSSLF